jgi:hypothetical protein
MPIFLEKRLIKIFCGAGRDKKGCKIPPCVFFPVPHFLIDGLCRQLSPEAVRGFQLA